MSSIAGMCVTACYCHWVLSKYVPCCITTQFNQWSERNSYGWEKNWATCIKRNSLVWVGFLFSFKWVPIMLPYSCAVLGDSILEDFRTTYLINSSLFPFPHPYIEQGIPVRTSSQSSWWHHCIHRACTASILSVSLNETFMWKCLENDNYKRKMKSKWKYKVINYK